VQPSAPEPFGSSGPFGAAPGIDPAIMGPMDESRPAGEATPFEPDADAVATLRAHLPEELAHLPVTSAAEYRKAAWDAWYIPPQPSGSYHPRFGFRGAAAMITGIFSVGGLWSLFTGRLMRGDVLENFLLWLFLIAATVLLVWSRWRSNRKSDRLEERNQVLSDVSHRIDQEVEAGRIPLQPPQWEGETPGPL